MLSKTKKIGKIFIELAVLMTVCTFILSISATVLASNGAPGAATPPGGSGAPAAGSPTPTPTTPTTTSPGYVIEGQFIPLNPANYPEYAQLTPSSPTGMLNEFVGGLVVNLKFLLAAAAVLFIMIAAVKLIIAGGNEETVTKQKAAITYGIIGLAIIGFGDELAKVLSVACAPGETECARGGFLKDPGNMIQQAGIFKRETRIFITFIKYLIGGIAVLMLVRNGIRLVALAGSEESVSLDKKNLIYTSIGLVLIIIASTFIDKVLFIVDIDQYSAGGVDPAISPERGIAEIAGVTNFAVTFTASVAVLVLIAGAIMYATAGGNEEQMGKAKRLIILSIIGMILIYGAFAIVSTIIAGQFTP